jgi:hypothetical protein
VSREIYNTLFRTTVLIFSNNSALLALTATADSCPCDKYKLIAPDISIPENDPTDRGCAFASNTSFFSSCEKARKAQQIPIRNNICFFITAILNKTV